MPSGKHVCQSVAPWMRHHFGRAALAPMTGQDRRAFHAFVHLLELYCVADSAGRAAALQAMRATVRAAQPKCRELFKGAIPHVLDWADEQQLWELIAPVDLLAPTAESAERIAPSGLRLVRPIESAARGGPGEREPDPAGGR